MKPLEDWETHRIVINSELAGKIIVSIQIALSQTENKKVNK